jgi:hypothetical protein
MGILNGFWMVTGPLKPGQFSGNLQNGRNLTEHEVQVLGASQSSICFTYESSEWMREKH